jgi:hypothetical protein
MTCKVVTRFLLLFVLLLYASPVYAEHTIEHVFDTDMKATFGASLRLRQEIWDNVVDLSTKQNDRNFFRLRASVWGKLDMGKGFDAFAKLTSEPKYFLGPYHPSMDAEPFQRLDTDEIIMDNAYLSAKKLFNSKVDVKIGRQDFLAPGDIYGEGFLITDGTPGDGSRTFYFNAAKVRLNITQDNSVDFVYINDPETDIFMPSVHPAISGNALYIDNKKLLTTSDEQAFMIYSRNKLSQYFTFDPYYIRKTEHAWGATPGLTLHTFGGRVAFTCPEGWRAKAELARQVGHYGDNPGGQTGNVRSGLGGYLFAGRQFAQTTGKPEFDLGVVYLSGDDPKTPDKREAWDPLFSRNPYWNELYIYTLIGETAKKYSGPIPGYWTNMIIYMIKGKVNLAEKTSLTLTYQYLTAPESTTDLSSTMFTNKGKVRGSLPTAILNQTFSKNLDGFVQLEYFAPGSFYTANTENAWFFRWQLNFKL